VIAAVVLAAAILRPVLRRLLDGPAVSTWATVFVAIAVQAMPFLVLGVTVSGAIAAFLPDGAISRLLPERPAFAVPIAAAAGVALPGCECGSVPIAGRLVARGAPPAAALAFMLSAPAVNPVVVVATAVAFPGNPRFVVARVLASLLAATVVGLVWARTAWKVPPPRERGSKGAGSRRLETFLATAQHDFVHAGGFLVIGAATAATLQTVVPRHLIDGVAAGPFAVLALAILAVALAICSEADAFVAASLQQFSSTSRLVFLVVGPMVDVKLIALQVGTFGRAFAIRFAPLTFVVAVSSGLLVGGWLL